LPDDNDTTGISGIDISVIFEDSYGVLWFGRSYLDKLNRKDTSFTYYLPALPIFLPVSKSILERLPWNTQSISSTLLVTGFISVVTIVKVVSIRGA